MVLNEQIQQKWGPILEHEDLPQIEGTYKKSVTAVLLENQEKMMREQSAQQRGSGLFLTEDPMGSGMGIDSNSGNPVGSVVNPAPTGTESPAQGSVQFVDPVLISLVRRTMPKLMAYDICGVQPLTGPTGLIFAMRSHYGNPASTAEPIDEFFAPGGDTFMKRTGHGLSTAEGENMGMDAYSNRQRDTAGTWGGTPNPSMQEMSFSIEKMSVTAQTRKLRGQYTLEMAQDLKATHGLNAESELANILSNEILAEINRQVIRTVYRVASKGAENASTAGTFDLLVDSNGRWSVEKFKGLMFQLEMEANKIARMTRRGKGNVVICSADVASALQMTGILDNATGLKNNLNSDEANNLFAGVLNGQFRVYIDPYMPIQSKSMVVVGYKGTSPYDAGVFYCPYQPLQMLKAQDPGSFTPIIGFMSRDAMVANPFSQLETNGDGFIDPSYRPKRISGNGVSDPTDWHSNVYYRKMMVSNLS